MLLRGSRRRCFNPRPRAGGDLFKSQDERSLGLFQSTPPRRGRPHKAILYSPLMVFQSTPPRRGRLTITAAGAAISEFQSTPPRRGRLYLYDMLYRFFSSFNPRPRAGGDAPSLIIKTVYQLFQSTPPRRGRRQHSRLIH